MSELSDKGGEERGRNGNNNNELFPPARISSKALQVLQVAGVGEAED